MLPSLRTRLLLIFLLPTLGLFLLAGATAYVGARQLLEDELGRALAGQGAAVASQLSSERVLMLQPGDDNTRTFRNLSRTVEELRAATGARRIFVFDTAGRARLDSAGRLPIGTEVPELARDRYELSSVFRGKARASAVLFEGTDRRLYKTGYAPLFQDGQVVGAVGVEGSAAFFTPLARLTRAFVGWSLAALVVLGALALWTGESLTRPLRRLMYSAGRIASGDLRTAVPPERTREIGVLARELESMRRALESREQQLKMMLAGVAHEVRNPLGGMELFAGLLAEELAAVGSTALGDAQSHLHRLMTDLTYLNRIVEDFLSFAKDETLKPEPVEMERLAPQVQAMLAPDAALKQVAFHLDVQKTQLSADPNLLLSALVNLAKNAIQAAPVGSTVLLKGSAGAERYQWSVLNAGPPIPASVREKIFEPFYTTREKGSGLGLPLARKIARAHRGDLTLLQTPETTSFIFELPL